MGPEIIVFIALFAAIFGMYFLRSRENLAMIERGINPRKNYGGPKPYAYMKYSLLLIGAGIGLFAAYMIDVTYLQQFSIRTASDGTQYHQDNEAIYFALLAIGGGAGLFIAYLFEKKHMINNNASSDSQ